MGERDNGITTGTQSVNGKYVPCTNEWTGLGLVAAEPQAFATPRGKGGSMFRFCRAAVVKLALSAIGCTPRDSETFQLKWTPSQRQHAVSVHIPIHRPRLERVWDYPKGD